MADMKYRNLGRSGLSVSEISLGSWLTLGSSVDRAATREIVHAAYDLGINFFDTADAYANGAGEEALGAALQGFPRRYVVIATKCFFPMSDRPNDRGLSRKHIFESVEDSLRRLGSDYIDLLQCHRADPNTPLEETVCAFEDLIRQGKILYWGTSEWRAEQIAEACQVADAQGISMAQLALAWCLRQPNVSSAIVGATRRQQLEENAKASGLKLPDDVVAKIDALFPV